MRKSIFTVLAAPVLLAAASGVIAAPASAEEVSVAVPYADLDLATPAGEAALARRIETAVKTVCEKPDVRDLKVAAAWEACKAEARAEAFEQLSILEPFERLELASVF